MCGFARRASTLAWIAVLLTSSMSTIPFAAGEPLQHRNPRPLGRRPQSLKFRAGEMELDQPSQVPAGGFAGLAPPDRVRQGQRLAGHGGPPRRLEFQPPVAVGETDARRLLVGAVVPARPAVGFAFFSTPQYFFGFGISENNLLLGDRPGCEQGPPRRLVQRRSKAAGRPAGDAVSLTPSGASIVK